MNTGGAFRVPRSRAFQTHQALREEILHALEPVLFGSNSRAADITRQFEQAFAREAQQSYAAAVHSGTIGLFLALRACGVGEEDEVITVGNSDISTTAAIRHCHATPVLCDVLETDYTINPQLVEPLITHRTRALLPVDLYGHPANVAALRPLAQQYGLKIIEDAALAAGATDAGHPVGAYADATVFSFAPFKPLGSVGNGAMVVTNDQELDQRLRRLIHYGHAAGVEASVPGHQHYVAEGFNVPLDVLQATLLSIKLPFLAEWTERRQAISQAYAQGLVDLPVRLPRFRPESNPTFRAYTIRADQQQRLYQDLRSAGIEVVLHYTPAIYQHPIYSGTLPGSKTLPVTDQLAAELLCLPVAPELTDADIAYVLDVLRDRLPK